LSTLPEGLVDAAREVLRRCKKRGWTVATAESCTGGLVAAALTEIAGSSAVVDRGFVTYSNEAKMAMLGVPEATLRIHGAVSPETAAAMAEGALANSDAQLAVSITGIAGPGGATEGKPVGLVCFGLAGRDRPTRTLTVNFGGDRPAIRRAAAGRALALLAGTAKWPAR